MTVQITGSRRQAETVEIVGTGESSLLQHGDAAPDHGAVRRLPDAQHAIDAVPDEIDETIALATSLFLTGKSPELIERMAKMAPLEWLGQPADIASTVWFLVGPDGGWINGQVLRANGGLV